MPSYSSFELSDPAGAQLATGSGEEQNIVAGNMYMSGAEASIQSSEAVPGIHPKTNHVVLQAQQIDRLVVGFAIAAELGTWFTRFPP